MSDHRKRERILPSSNCHVFLALRREKDNADGYEGRSIFRQIIRDEFTDIKVLEAKCLSLGGMWRIYRTVNKRCFVKAFKMFQHRLIDDGEEYVHRLDSLWMNTLLKQESRAEKFFMIDYDDDKENFKSFVESLEEDSVKVVSIAQSPGGYHIITHPFKVSSQGKDEGRCFKYKGVDVLKDGYVFVKMVGGDRSG